MSDLAYDLVIIGGGAAGLVAAVSAGALRVKTALIERGRLGGECSWTGCIPSKTLLSFAGTVHRANKYYGSIKGIGKIKPEHNKDIFKKIKLVTEEASKASKAKKLLDKYNVDIIFGDASFIDNHNLKINNKKIRAKKVIISTGSSAIRPEIKGLEPGYLTNREIWDLKKIPESMLIIGAGPIGLEMAQAFNRLGTRIHIFDSGKIILPGTDRELSLELIELLKKEKIDLHMGTRINWIKMNDKKCTICTGADGKIFSAEKLLVAVGRKSNTEGLGLEAAGIKYNNNSIQTDKYLRTSAKNIWAAGDCNGINQFSHFAEVEAKIAVRNALFPLNSTVDYQGTPWTIFTDPEMAHFGFTEEECRENGFRFKAYTQSFSGDDRAVTEGRTQGKVKILATISGKILGAHILGPRAGELINEFVLARRKSARIYDIGLTAHVYPTLGMAVQRAADQWFAETAEITPVRRLIRLARLIKW